MSPPIKRLLYWSPRILSILFAAFISLFALDVFAEGSGFWETVLALLIHLIPTFIIVAILTLSWKREWIGGILFLALGILYIVFSWGKFPWTTYVAKAGPLVLTGLLFLVGWRLRAE
ncbi:MAG: hypothetical protein FJ215_01105 [Ignavibacteria bacterium]|nr:hypothetical protein [Ignavibacteria bacterium]